MSTHTASGQCVMPQVNLNVQGMVLDEASTQTAHV